MWWSAAGVEHVRASLAELARRYRVDPDRVVAAGFSDGASGCFHLLAHDPDPYACFLALMGNPMITRLLGGPAFAGNCTARPTWAVNGGQDEQVPADLVEPIIAQMKEAGIAIEWKAIPEATHSMELLTRESAAMLAFGQAHPRDPLPKRVDWECVLPQIDGRRAWVEVLSVHAAAPGAPDVPSQPLPMPDVPKHPRLGIKIDTTHPETGLRIETVEPGTPAAEAGFRPGDVIVKVGAEDLPKGRDAFVALRDYLAGLEEVDGEFTVQRESETVTIKTRPRVLASDGPDPALGYGKPSGRVVAEVKEGNRIEVKTRGVGALRLHLARPLVDLEKEVVVVLNGKEVFKGVPKPDAAYLLDQTLRRLPGDPLYEANLTLKP
jgi:membrane-associated protease RseP (regulator of RpoE activity)